MPNHCGNRLTVTGDFKARQEFVDGVKNEDDDPKIFDFHRVVPIPDKMDTVDGHNHFWGTKWGAYDGKLEHNEEKTVFTFLTAWCPASNEFMEILAAKFPNVKLDLRYAEQGVGFYGYWTNIERENLWKTGLAKQTECWKFQNDDVRCIDGDEEREEEYKLRPGLEMYAKLYDMSG